MNKLLTTIKENWNNSSDEYNQWKALGLDEKINEVATVLDIAPADVRIITAAPEMLEALIKQALYFEKNKNYNDIQFDYGIIEKATGKTWEEIKEINKDE